MFIMKKVVLILAAAATLAACSKTEVAPVTSNENSEITFNVAPRTKADPNPENDFNHDNVFASWAYYLAPGSTWDANSADAKSYIVNSTVSYQSNDSWKNTDKSYYWPKDGGSLTFFAYSLNKSDLELNDNDKQHPSGFTCLPDNGITGHIDLQANPNVDFLVADIAKDQKANSRTYYHNGVPTLFRHRLSRVECKVKTNGYANTSFTLNSIKFTNLSHYATYGQLPSETISPSGTKVDFDYTAVTQNVTTEMTVVAKEKNVIYIPQSFEDENAKIEVSYTVTYSPEGSEKDVVMNCVASYPIKNYFAKWEMGKRYIFNITFTLDEVLWDPYVQDWEDVTKDITIE